MHDERPEQLTEIAIRRVLRDPATMVLNYQPVADLRQGTATGYEVLARFGGSRPEDWFAAAEAAGLGPRADRAIVQHALEARRGLPANAFLTVNVGPASLSDSAFADVVDGRFDLRGLVFEITEHQRVDDYARLTRATGALRAQGAMIAVDDAGAGYASMRHVLALRPQFVKVDREFVSGCDRDGARAALIEAIGAYAGRLDAWVIAEGVETRDELHTLMDLGVPLAQGYLFGEPRPAWSSLDSGIGAEIRARAGMETRPMLACAVLAGPSRGTGGSEVTIDGVVWRVDADEWSRPLALACEGTDPRPVMRVAASTDPATALSRAMTRPAVTRFDPLAITGEAGEFLGLAPIDRLIGAALRASRAG